MTVTLMDGLVLARSTFHHSMNYRSCVILGQGEAVTDLEEKRAVLEGIVEHIIPGRNAEVRCNREDPGPLQVNESRLRLTDVGRIGRLSRTPELTWLTYIRLNARHMQCTF